MAKTSIKTIAEIAGVSKTTVSFVLNGHGNDKNISKTTQERIKRIASQHNYHPSHLARSLSSGRTHTIGFIVPDISNPFFAKIGKYVESFSEEKGYTVMFASSDEDPQKEKKLIEGFWSRQIDGIILAPAANIHSQNTPLSQSFHPMVYFDRIYPNQKDAYIDINNYDSTMNLCLSLIKNGHQRIALMSLTSYLPNISYRIEGYKAALNSAGITIDDQLIFDIDFHHKKRDVQQSIQTILQMNNPATAILFLNNMLTAEGIWTINKNHPDKIDTMDFASFDNLDLFDYAKPTVTSALQPIKAIARECVNRIFRQIEESKQEAGVCLNTTIIER